MTRKLDVKHQIREQLIMAPRGDPRKPGCNRHCPWLHPAIEEMSGTEDKDVVMEDLTGEVGKEDAEWVVKDEVGQETEDVVPSTDVQPEEDAAVEDAAVDAAVEDAAVEDAAVEDAAVDAAVEDAAVEEKKEESKPAAVFKCCPCPWNSKCAKCVCSKLGGCRPACASRKCMYKVVDSEVPSKQAVTPAKVVSPVATVVKSEVEEKPVDVEMTEDTAEKSIAEEEQKTPPKSVNKKDAKPDVEVVKKEAAKSGETKDAAKNVNQKAATSGKKKVSAKSGDTSETTKKVGEKAASKKADKKASVPGSKDEASKPVKKDVKKVQKVKGKQSVEKAAEKKGSSSQSVKIGTKRARQDSTKAAVPEYFVPTAQDFECDLDGGQAFRTMLIGPMGLADLSACEVFAAMKQGTEFFVDFMDSSDVFIYIVYATEQEMKKCITDLKDFKVPVKPFTETSVKVKPYTLQRTFDPSLRSSALRALNASTGTSKVVAVPGIPLDMKEQALAAEFPDTVSVFIPKQDQCGKGYGYVELKEPSKSVGKSLSIELEGGGRRCESGVVHLLVPNGLNYRLGVAERLLRYKIEKMNARTRVLHRLEVVRSINGLKKSLQSQPSERLKTCLDRLRKMLNTLSGNAPGFAQTGPASSRKRTRTRSHRKRPFRGAVPMNQSGQSPAGKRPDISQDVRVLAANKARANGLSGGGNRVNQTQVQANKIVGKMQQVKMGNRRAAQPVADNRQRQQERRRQLRMSAAKQQAAVPQYDMMPNPLMAMNVMPVSPMNDRLMMSPGASSRHNQFEEMPSQQRQRSLERRSQWDAPRRESQERNERDGFRSRSFRGPGRGSTPPRQQPSQRPHKLSERGPSSPQFEDRMWDAPRSDRHREMVPQFDERRQAAHRYDERQEMALQYEERRGQTSQFDNRRPSSPPLDDRRRQVPQYFQRRSPSPEFGERRQSAPQFDERGRAIPQYADERRSRPSSRSMHGTPDYMDSRLSREPMYEEPQQERPRIVSHREPTPERSYYREPEYDGRQPHSQDGYDDYRQNTAARDMRRGGFDEREARYSAAFGDYQGGYAHEHSTSQRGQTRNPNFFPGKPQKRGVHPEPERKRRRTDDGGGNKSAVDAGTAMNLLLGLSNLISGNMNANLSGGGQSHGHHGDMEGEFIGAGTTVRQNTEQSDLFYTAKVKDSRYGGGRR